MGTSLPYHGGAMGTSLPYVLDHGERRLFSQQHQVIAVHHLDPF
jgi:hypothetical protein